MAQLNITLNEEQVRELFKGSMEEIMKELLERTLNELLHARAEDLCGAKPYEQTSERIDYRNGIRHRTFKTRLGRMRLVVPRLRNQSVIDGLIGKYKRSEKALVAGIAAMSNTLALPLTCNSQSFHR